MLNLQMLVRNFPVCSLALELEHRRQWHFYATPGNWAWIPLLLCRCWKHRCNYDWQPERHGDLAPDREWHESDNGYWSGEKAWALDESILHLLHLGVIFHCHSSNHGILYFLFCSETQDCKGPIQESGEFVRAIAFVYPWASVLWILRGKNTGWAPKLLNLLNPQEGVRSLKC